MSGTDSMPAGSSAPVERVITFVDAAVAIALTLLILPLMEQLTDPAGHAGSTADFLSENSGALTAFAISFVVIADFWLGHHRLYQHIAWEFPWLFWTNMGWLMTIVFLPVATAMTTRGITDRLQYVVYIGTMVLTCLMQALMTWLASRHPESWRAGHEIPAREVARSLAVAIGFTVAMMISVSVPRVGYWSLLILFLVGPLHRLATGVRDRDKPGSGHGTGHGSGRVRHPRRP